MREDAITKLSVMRGAPHVEEGRCRVEFELATDVLDELTQTRSLREALALALSFWVASNPS